MLRLSVTPENEVICNINRFEMYKNLNGLLVATALVLSVLLVSSFRDRININHPGIEFAFEEFNEQEHQWNRTFQNLLANSSQDYLKKLHESQVIRCFELLDSQLLLLEETGKVPLGWNIDFHLHDSSIAFDSIKTPLSHPELYPRYQMVKQLLQAEGFENHHGFQKHLLVQLKGLCVLNANPKSRTYNYEVMTHLLNSVDPAVLKVQPIEFVPKGSDWKLEIDGKTLRGQDLTYTRLLDSVGTFNSTARLRFKNLKTGMPQEYPLTFDYMVK